MKQTQSLQDHYRWCSAIHCKDGLPYSLAAARLSLDNPPKPTNKQNLSVATQFGAAVLRRLSYPTPQAKTMFLTSPLKQKPFCGSTTSQCQLHAGDQPQTTGGTTTDTPHKSEYLQPCSSNHQSLLGAAAQQCIKYSMPVAEDKLAEGG